jgi:hypothetical protein
VTSRVVLSSVTDLISPFWDISIIWLSGTVTGWLFRLLMYSVESEIISIKMMTYTNALRFQFN